MTGILDRSFFLASSYVCVYAPLNRSFSPCVPLRPFPWQWDTEEVDDGRARRSRVAEPEVSSCIRVPLFFYPDELAYTTANNSAGSGLLLSHSRRVIPLSLAYSSYGENGILGYTRRSGDDQENILHWPSVYTLVTPTAPYMLLHVFIPIP